jgi:hypothetical protein
MTRIFTGTASVVNGSAVVTILTGGPLSDANAPADGSVMLDGLGYFIGERLTNSTFELTRNYEGSTGTVDCEIDPLTPKAISLFNVSREITDYNSRLALLEADGKGLFYSILGTTGASDPGAGKLARNEDAWSDVTEIYLDVIDAGDMEATPLIDTWSAGTVVTVRSIATRAYASFTLAGASTNEGSGAWRKLTGLTYLGGDGILVDDEDVAIEWNRPGATGATGAIGVSGGITLTFDDPTADADPGAGKFRLNNATHASATAAYIDNAEAMASADISGLLDSWDDSTATIKGTLTIASKANPAIFRTYNVTGSVVNGTGYRKVTIAYVTGAGTLADETSCTLVFSRTGNNGVDGINGVDGSGLFSRVRAVSTANITIATALNNGDTIDGVTLATSDLVLVAGQTAPAENGVYVVGASPARATAFATYDSMPGVGIRVMEGTVNADTTWFCNSNKGGTLGSTALVFEQSGSAIASKPEAIAGTDNTKSMSPLRVREVLDGSPLSGFRNKLINGDFLFFQRAGSQAIAAGASAYVADRWLVANNTNQSVTVSQQDMTPGQVLVPGNPRRKIRFAFSVAPTTGTLRVEQRIEDVFTLAGKTASARAHFTGPSGSETLACEAVQNFGTGGSPSTAVTTAAASIDVATIYNAGTQVRRAQFSVPSVSSKVLGTGKDDYLALAWTLTPRQSGNYEMARASLVEGDATGEADPFSPRHVQQEDALCKRYFEPVGLINGLTGCYASTFAIGATRAWSAVKRSVPTCVVSGISATILAGVSLNTVYRDVGSYALLFNTSSAVGTLGIIAYVITADSEL